MAALETALYLPVKRFLETLGFTVKGEIGGCDLVALSGDDPPIVVIGELKLAFNLELVLRIQHPPKSPLDQDAHGGFGFGGANGVGAVGGGF